MAAILVRPPASHGEIVTVRVTGRVMTVDRLDATQFDLDDSVAIGGAYELSFVVDTAAPDLDARPDWGRYLLAAFSGQLGAYTWSRTAPPVYEIETANDLEGVDLYQFSQGEPDLTGPFIVQGTPLVLNRAELAFLFVGVNLTDFGAGALTSDSLVLPTLEDWTFAEFVMHIELDESVIGDNWRIIIRGDVTSITVPEPGTAAVMALSSLICIGRCGRRSWWYASKMSST